jgi:processive rubber oxygenase RoxA-like protein
MRESSMKKPNVTTVLLLACAAAGGCSGSVGSGDGTVSAANTSSSWSTVRAQRQAALAAYVTANNDDFMSFKNVPLGNTGIPMVMLRVFPLIFPDIWGGPNDYFNTVGLGPDTLQPGRVLPLGLGHIASQPAIPVPTPQGTINVNVHVANLTCMGCHDGKVIGSDGNVQNLIGAPSTTFDQFRGNVLRTVNDPRYTAANFLAALNAQPLGYVYGDPALAQQEALERAIFNAPATSTAPSGADQFLGQLKAGANAGAARFGGTLGAYTYQVPNAPSLSAPTPGFLDAIGAGIAIIVDPTQFTPTQLQAILPPAPAEIDIMSTWNQKNRPAAQWDGAIISQLHRNLGAEFGVIGDPAHVNMDNANRTTRFTQSLPPPPYPFNVDMNAAADGKQLFQNFCATCHYPGNATIFPTSYVGTDANRANIWSSYTVAGLQQALAASCTDPTTCTDNNPNDLARSTGGYMALPLDGIWARAPYLHNGSVPTLYALLTGDRPAQFYRGNVAYDQKKVGFVADQAAPGAFIYDTTLSGHSNAGHSSADFLGKVPWKNSPDALYKLLEYMKTL